MRIFIFGLLLAISYAQTETEVDEERSIESEIDVEEAVGSECGVWGQIPNAQLFGLDDVWMEGVTVQQCKDACCENPRCKSFDYHKFDDNCALSYSAEAEIGGLIAWNKGDPYDYYFINRGADPETMPAYTEIAEEKKCEMTGNRQHPATRAVCEQEARDNNADYFTYEFRSSTCYYSTTCSNKRRLRVSGGGRWRIFQRDQSQQTAAAAGPAYTKQPGLDQKCEKTGNEEHNVDTRGACEAEAKDNNADYYSYSSRQKKCFYSTTCSNIVSGRRTRTWKIYKRDQSHQTAVFQVVGTTYNAITMFAIIGAVTMLYHGLKGVQKMMFTTSKFQQIKDNEMVC